MQVYKPGSVFRKARNPYHFSSLNFAIEINQPTRPVITRIQPSKLALKGNRTYLVFQHARFTMPYMSP